VKAAEFRENQLDAQLIISDRLAALGKMAAGIGHEINNPLAVMFQITGWMKDLLQEEDPQKCRHYEEYEVALEKLDAHIKRARTVVHNMLAYAGRLGPRAVRADINEILSRAIAVLENYARINNIEIQKDFSADVPSIRVDPEQLEQVFFNFISNAIDAIEKEGTIHIETGVAESQIVIHITDDGPGIPEEDRERIFDPFFTTKITGKGTGLGLWVNYSLIQKMGGAIQLQSEPGKGTTFTVSLPIPCLEEVNFKTAGSLSAPLIC